ncbi:MAG: GTP pyrophosphokinase family protein [Clostridioides sp.]|jgi:putative GTP pyrophosphokinase|nr:GTP pyrophosphokinase family protein [Clostridioides sp.]
MEYEKWEELLTPYNHAVEELKVKFKNIRKEYLERGDYSPIEFVTGRRKKISSIIEKMKRLNSTDMEKDLDDIAGIRVMCQFVEDIYVIVEMIRKRSDMKVIAEKDYINNYKASGYRSYHVIIKYPINSIKESKEIICEIQIRTLAMNFWATIEHSLKYKYHHFIPEEIAQRLRRAADAAFMLDKEMSEIRGDIMNAQEIYQRESIIIRETQRRVQELYDIGETNKAMNYQRILEKNQNEQNIEEIISLKSEMDTLLQQYKMDDIKKRVIE